MATPTPHTASPFTSFPLPEGPSLSSTEDPALPGTRSSPHTLATPQPALNPLYSSWAFPAHNPGAPAPILNLEDLTQPLPSLPRHPMSTLTPCLAGIRGPSVQYPLLLTPPFRHSVRSPFLHPPNRTGPAEGAPWWPKFRLPSPLAHGLAPCFYEENSHFQGLLLHTRLSSHCRTLPRS